MRANIPQLMITMQYNSHMHGQMVLGVSKQKWTKQKTTFWTISLEIQHTQKKIWYQIKGHFWRHFWNRTFTYVHNDGEILNFSFKGTEEGSKYMSR